MGAETIFIGRGQKIMGRGPHFSGARRHFFGARPIILGREEERASRLTRNIVIIAIEMTARTPQDYQQELMFLEEAIADARNEWGDSMVEQTQILESLEETDLSMIQVHREYTNVVRTYGGVLGAERGK